MDNGYKTREEALAELPEGSEVLFFYHEEDEATLAAEDLKSKLPQPFVELSTCHVMYCPEYKAYFISIIANTAITEIYPDWEEGFKALRENCGVRISFHSDPVN